MYNVEALEKGIIKIKTNIKVLEKAIQDERDRIEEYRGMIDAVQRKAIEKAMAEKDIQIIH